MGMAFYVVGLKNRFYLKIELTNWAVNDAIIFCKTVNLILYFYF